MSTITKEQVQSVADLKAGYTLGHADVAILNKLARIALASLEAEPAIHRWRRVTFEPYGPYPWHYGTFIGFSKPVEGIEDEYYYSAPPAPVSVPDESTIFDAAIDICRKSDAIDEHAWNHGVLAVMSAFSDCRAAMRQGGSSPAIPDGWVSVIDQTPDEYDFDIWVFSPSIGVQDGVQWDGLEFADDEYQFRIKDVSHWMKKVYPAAPQQEVK